MKREKLLLHSCCGPCSTAVIEQLMEEYDITVFFYNPNITDLSEYEKRKKAQLLFLNQYNEQLTEEKKVCFIEGDYEPDAFYQITRGLESEPEGGIRCTQCFRLRLEKSAQMAQILEIENFTTTLSVSPHKNYKLICQLGNEFAEKYGCKFLMRDFKKKAGFQRSVALSKEYGLYRQNYCGCEFSKWE
ncbi:epoxyqueuosine reductase QueH [Anaerovorax sp. IOR16]|uniref:epoxyqueuosine reductase QueH n=1 Tax=Anaerovorax sp. IOR16 TaxID=2773458 RepID=UPI0019CFCC29|nr:epoxyqueuosine reductase QueH [Anaerovorax sp. IOR16]